MSDRSRSDVPPPAIIAVGASTGGPNALVKVFESLPVDFQTPIVIVQHMPPMFTRLLAERLDGLKRVRVREAEDGHRLVPGRAWVAPGRLHLEVAAHMDGHRLRLHDGPPENFCRPAVDVLFRSVAAAFGPRALAIVLTGMGRDGLEGARAIRDAGGEVFAQDQATSVVWGMPMHVAAAGLASRVLPDDQLGLAAVEWAWGREGPRARGGIHG